MAKDSRTNDELREAKRAKKAEKKRAELKAKKKASRANVLTVVAIVVLFALAIGLVGLKAVINSGVIERHTTVMSTDNHSISTSILTYFFNANYRSEGSSYVSYGLIDSSKSLRDQYISDGYSWFDYMMVQAENEVGSYLIMAEGAKAAGIELDEHDLEVIDEYIDSIKEAAATYGYANTNSFIKANYGVAVNLKDVRAAMELAQLAAKYQETMTDKYIESYTSADYDKQYADNKNNYNYVDYYSFTFTAEKGEGDKMTDETKAAAKALAEELKATGDVDGFKAYVEEYLTNKAQDELKENETLNKSDIVDAMNKLESTHVSYSTLNSASADIAKWAFESASAGDIKENYDETNGTYTVYLLEKAPYRDEYTTHNGAYIFLSNSANTDAAGAAAKADEIIAEWESGDKTEEAFLELVRKYSEAGHDHIEENIKKDLAYSDWFYATDRKAGDVDKVVSSDDKGVYIVYYAGQSELTAWQADAQADLAAADFNAHYTELAGTYYVTINDEKAARVIPVTINVSTSAS